MQRFELVIFEFDGTLVDTGPVICQAFAAAVAATRAARPAGAVRPLLGQPLERVYQLLQGELGEPLDVSLEEFIERYRREHDAHADAGYRLFDDVDAVLSEVRGRMAIASTKPTRVLDRHARQLGIDRYFQHIQGTDGFPHKPDPAILHRVWQRVPSPPRETVFVGDSTMDMRAGRAAGVTCIGVTHGAHDRRRLLAAGAHHVVDSIRELRDHL